MYIIICVEIHKNAHFVKLIDETYPVIGEDQGSSF